MRATRLLGASLLLLAMIVETGCYWKSTGPKGTNLDALQQGPRQPPGQPPARTAPG